MSVCIVAQSQCVTLRLSCHARWAVSATHSSSRGTNLLYVPMSCANSSPVATPPSWCHYVPLASAPTCNLPYGLTLGHGRYDTTGPHTSCSAAHATPHPASLHSAIHPPPLPPFTMSRPRPARVLLSTPASCPPSLAPVKKCAEQRVGFALGTRLNARVVPAKWF